MSTGEAFKPNTQKQRPTRANSGGVPRTVPKRASIPINQSPPSQIGGLFVTPQGSSCIEDSRSIVVRETSEAWMIELYDLYVFTLE
jgi:hypothetical protein